jgi:UDP-N-acetylmuramoyl-L-alanyl-D-glutamate--2,6-diaminopimelate ligase
VQNLHELLFSVGLQPSSMLNPLIQGITADSRTVNPGDLFLAYPGVKVDGRHYIKQAIDNGAVACLIEADSTFTCDLTDVPIIEVKQLQQQCSALAKAFFLSSSTPTHIIGVTGTNGKTSCSHFCAQILSAMNQKVGVLGTVGNGVWPQLSPSNMTTQDAIACQQQLAAWNDQSIDAVSMEVSSHALVQGRVNAVDFTTAIFTGLTRDHLDYHGTMSAYAQAKSLLFKRQSLQSAVLNWDDPVAPLMLEACHDEVNVVGFSMDAIQAPIPLIHPKRIDSTHQGFSVDLMSPWGEVTLTIPLLGLFNIQNVMASIAALCASGYNFHQVCEQVATLKPVCGRMQLLAIEPHQAQVVVDYAHTPDALKQVLQSLRSHCLGKLWCVFGCGGERDRGKRAEMATMAEQFADEVVVTSDNSRGECEQQIVQDILKGFTCAKKIHVQMDRQLAVEHAVQSAIINDMVLLAGRGHEIDQVRQQKVLRLSDAQLAQLAMTAKS